MEGEVFEKDVLENKMPPTKHQDLPNGKLVNGVNGVNGVQHPDLKVPQAPRKPWESVHFDPSLQPKDYQIKGECGSRKTQLACWKLTPGLEHRHT